MSDLPPLPAGFQLEGATPRDPSLPALPAGFQMESAPAKPQGVVGNIMDAVKGIPRNLAAGFLDAATTGAQAEAHAMSQPDLAAEIPNTEQALKAVEPVTGQLYEPQGALGKIVGAGARTLTNPASYVGPGGLALKMGANALSGMGGEVAGQATEGTPYEAPARLAGSLAGGMIGAKLLGPTAETAAVPTQRELKIAADKGYNAARNSGLEIDPKGLANVATQAQQDLTVGPKYAFTGGPDGSAPKTLALLDKLQAPPAGATVTASNLDTIRRQINNIAGETKDFKPTADAKAAMVLKEKFANYLENIPPDHVVAGSPADFSNALKQANGDYAASMRDQSLGVRLTKAENQANRSKSLGANDTIPQKIAPFLDNKKQQRGFTPQEIAQAQAVHDGTLASNLARLGGKFGVNDKLSLALALGAGAGTGGASVPISIAGTLSKALANHLTKSEADKLSAMLRMRSPEYAARVSTLPPPPSSMGNWAAIARAPILGMR